ncbi:hypothetical protein [Bacillus sp. Brlt_9]|uniref:hypothetical protein n=1 Tax=Bacillus sp. Brlt_9 TaxID=3110916 RepID=UPI003F7B4A5D
MDINNTFHLAAARLSVVVNEKGERIGKEIVPEKVMKWYKETNAITDNWFQKLVNREDGFGIFAVLEFNHPGVLDLRDKECNDWGTVNAEEIIKNIAQIAQRMKEITKVNDVYVGRSTGTKGRHEIGLFFPYGMTREQQEQVFFDINKNTDYIFQITNE